MATPRNTRINTIIQLRDISSDSFQYTGDFNADGVINVLDIVSLVDSILVAGEYNINADVNQDGFNNVLDVVEIVNIIIGQ